VYKSTPYFQGQKSDFSLFLVNYKEVKFRPIEISKWSIFSSSECIVNTIKVLCEQTREVNKLVKRFFGLCLILSGLGNIVVDFHF